MGRGAVEAESFDRRYLADPDPWDYETSAYEREKYERTLASVGSPSRALEIGCSNGAFTAQLAELAGSVLAVDFSSEAVRLADYRTGGGNVTVERRDVRLGLPAGPFEAIVCSEVLYYWAREDVLRFCERARDALASDGVLVAVHWRGDDPFAPLDGDSVHRLLAQQLEPSLVNDDSSVTEDYRLDRWRAPLEAIGA